jgi:hypothetical protein
VKRIAGFTIVATAVAVLAVLVATAVYAQGQVLAEIAERNRVLRLQGIRGLVGGLFRPDRRNTQGDRRQSEMIKAYKAGVPGNGQPFPEGSMIVKLQWKLKKSTEAPFVVEVPDVFKPGLRHGKGQQEISEKRRVGIRGVQLRSRIGQVHGRSQKPLRLRIRVPYAVKAKDYIFHPYQKR